MLKNLYIIVLFMAASFQSVGQSLTTDPISSSQLCGGTTISVSYSSTGATFNAGNIFTAELSNAAGSFATPISLGTFSSTASSGTISGNISPFITSGTGYRIRVVSSNTALTGADNGTNLTINPKVTSSVTISNNATLNTICAGTSVIFTAAPTNGGPTPSYQWKKNSTNVGTNSATYTDAGLSNNDVITCEMTSSAPCPVTATVNSNSITMTVNPIPTVNAITDQTLCNGAATTAVTFGGTISGTTYNWTNNTASIGLAASGSGDISSFTATNSGATAVVATITVTPTASGCNGSTESFDITVNPSPKVPVADQNVCNGNNAAVTFNSTVTGSTFAWTNNTTSIGLAASGTGNISSFAATNAGTTTVTATITVTPTANGCTGPDSTFDINVHPTPTVNSIADQNLCNAAASAAVNFTGAVSGTTYNWTNTTTSIGLAASGTGNIASFTATNTGTAPVTTTVTVTPIANSCLGASESFDITVNPTPTVNASSDQSICNGTTASVTFTGAISGTVYNWINNTTSIGLAASGAGNISSFTATNSGSAPVTATIIVTPTANGCSGTPDTFDITVNPTPTVNTIADQNLCHNSATAALNITGAVTGTTYNWTNTATSIGLAASGAGDIASFTATNTGLTPVTATITVVPTANGCLGASEAFDITVSPIPTVNASSNQNVCNGATAAVTYTGSISSAAYNWTNNTTSIGLAASGTGNISFSATNLGTTPVTATIIVTPTAYGCSGTPDTFDITVNPTPNVNIIADQNLCHNSTTAAVTFIGAVTGTTYNWTNTAASIGLAASGSGDIASFTATNTGITPVTATITVTPIANGCLGASDAFDITVNPIPAVNATSNQNVCNGATAAVTFAGSISSATYNWTNNTTSIGLAASGTGNISSFTATNSGTAPVTATVIVTPTAYGCTGTPDTFDIVVNPTPTVNTVADQTLCKGTPTTAVNFTGAVAGTTYNWTNNTASIGLAASGSGDIASFIAANAGTTPVTATITVTPTINGCVGANDAFDITVTPTPSISITDKSICHGASLAVPLSSPVTGTTVTWTNDNTAIGLAASGTGDIASFTATNTGTVPVIATIIVTPTATCPGANDTFTITVNPIVVPSVTVTVNPTTTVCPGTSITFTAAPVNGGTAPTYAWTRNGTAVGTNSPTYASTALANNDVIACNVTSSACASPATVTDSKTASVYTTTSITTQPADQKVCYGTTANFTVAVAGSNLTYQWQINTGSGWQNVCTSCPEYFGYSLPTLSVSNTPSAMSGHKFKCIITGACGTVTSNEVTLTTSPNATATISSVSDTSCAGVLAFNVATTNAGTPTYAWKKNGTTVATTATYNATGLVTGDFIICYVTSGINCPATPVAVSNAKIITDLPISNTSIAITSPLGPNGCAGTPVVFSSTIANGGNNPKYQWKKNGTNIAGATNPTYTDNGLITGNIITCEMTSSLRCPNPATAASNSINITIHPVEVATVNVSASPDSLGCSGAAMTFNSHFTKGGANPAYQWQKNGADVAGATFASYTDASLNHMDAITVRFSSSQYCVAPIVSTPVTVRLTPTVTPSVTISAATLAGKVTFTADIANGGSNPILQWRVNGKDVPGANMLTYTATGLDAKDKVSLFMVSDLECVTTQSTTSNSILIEDVTGVEEVNNEIATLNLFPNPNTGSFTVRGKLAQVAAEKTVKVEVLNTIGQVVHRDETLIEGKELNININMNGSHAAGMYTVRLMIDGQVHSLRFMMKD